MISSTLGMSAAVSAKSAPASLMWLMTRDMTRKCSPVLLAVSHTLFQGIPKNAPFRAWDVARDEWSLPSVLPVAVSVRIYEGCAPTRHTGNDVQGRSRIGNGSAECAHHIEVSGVGDYTMARDEPKRGFDADDAVPVCWKDDLGLHRQYLADRG